jgi:hypothetical protein
MTTRGMPNPWRRRVKRAARKLLRARPGDRARRAARAMDQRDRARRAARAMDQRDRARRAGWSAWIAATRFASPDPGACMEGMEFWEAISP